MVEIDDEDVLVVPTRISAENGVENSMQIQAISGVEAFQMDESGLYKISSDSCKFMQDEEVFVFIQINEDESVCYSKKNERLFSEETFTY